MRPVSVFLAVALSALISGCSLLTPVEQPQTEKRSLVLWMPGASSVQVLADWNEWGGAVAAGGVIDPVSGNMIRGEDGFWTLDISHLRGGSYRYVFLVNGHRWLTDSGNPLTSEFRGNAVSLIMIPD